jgi:SAM-dependent methyltransferase
MTFSRVGAALLRPWWRLIRFGFRLLYNELAFTYDAVSALVSLGSWRCWGRSALNYLPEPAHARQPRILELAHGTGNLQLDLYARGYAPVGYDLSAAMGRITRRKLSRAGLVSRLVRGRGQQLPFATASFDAVVCTFPTDFILEAASLRELRRVLCPSGVLVIVINGTFTGRGALIRALEMLYEITGQRRRERRADPAASEEGALYQPYQWVFAQFAASGLVARLAEEPCPRGNAQLIIARRA